MGDWLSFRGNQRELNGVFPDENYAREVMQLFTIGLDMLNDDGTPQTDAQGLSQLTMPMIFASMRKSSPA